MFIVRITFAIKPAKNGNFPSVTQTCVNLAKAHKGCNTYEFLKDVQGDTHTLYEEWESDEYFKAYKLSPDFKKIGDLLTPYLANVPITNYFSAKVVDYKSFNALTQ